MAPVVAIAYKQIKEQKCGITFKQDTPHDPVVVSRIIPDGLFASSPLKAGMQVLSVNNIPIEDMSSPEAVQLIKDAVGQISIVAEDRPRPVLAIAQAVDVASVASSCTHTQNRGYIILKKTFKRKDFSNNEKSYSFHGPMNHEMISTINQKIRRLQLVQGANRLQFNLNQNGHFYGAMNHVAQKIHEEDFVVAILEAMEQLGWHFRFQYDSEFSSAAAFTGKELFIFHRMER